MPSKAFTPKNIPCIFYIFEVSSPRLGVFYYDLNSYSSSHSVQSVVKNGFY